MDAIAELFSLVCGRGRCFVIDGETLPLCQRCLGLYLGAALTGAWILWRRLWRRGAPPGGVLAIQATALLAAMLGGLHVPDGGSAWRLACGLWTGHVAVVWLLAGAGELRGIDRPWPRADTLIAAAMVPLLGSGALAYAAFLPPPRELWIAIALAGMASLALGAILAASAAVWRLLPGRRAVS